MIPGIVAGKPVWSVRSLAPSVWLNDISPLTAVSGAVSQWNDQSGNALHFAQATAGNRPQVIASGLNGRRTVRFDGTNDVLTNNSAGAKSIFRNVDHGWVASVYKKTAADGAGTDRSLFGSPRGGASVGSRAFCLVGLTAAANRPAVGGRRLDADALGTYTSPSTSAGAWVARLDVFNWAGREVSLYLNGSLDGTTGSLWSGGGNTSDTDANNPVSIGASYFSAATPGAFADVEVGELIVGRGSLTGTNISRLFEYLATRWGL